VNVQTNCPQCSQRLVIEDDKIPAAPFMLRCPKCQMALKLPGKAGASAPPPGADRPGRPAPPSAVAPPATTVAGVNAIQRPQQSDAAPAIHGGQPAPASVGADSRNATTQRALIALAGQAEQGPQSAVTSLLRRNGYSVETATEPKQGVLLLERNSYHVVVTTPNGGASAGGVSLYKRIVALAPEVRRDLFLVLLGNEFSSGDGTQAFAAMADLVLHPKDIDSSEDLLRAAVAERSRLYEAFREAQARLHKRKY